MYPQQGIEEQFTKESAAKRNKNYRIIRIGELRS